MGLAGDSGGGVGRGILIGAVVAAVVMWSFPVVAAVGDNLLLGKANTADSVTILSGPANANLRITNTQAGSPALDLRVEAGSPPLKVNSTARVANLNADRLDGKHASAFLLAGGTAADANLLDGLDSTAFCLAGHTQPFSSLTEVPAGLADGDDDSFAALVCADGSIPKYSGGAWDCGTDLNPSDANTLDGLDSLAFALSGHSHDASYISIVGGATSGNFPVFNNDGELFSSPYGPSSFLGATATAASADKVDNRHANELVRAAGNRVGDLPDQNGVVLSSSITAPTDGYLMITASMEVILLTSADSVSCSLGVDGGGIAGTQMSASVGEVQGTMANTCATNLTYGVSAGAHSVNLLVSGWYSAALGNGSMSVLFVPFGPTGS